MSEYSDDFTELLGAYALDAVDPDEREAIELHLGECPRCRAEVAEHREVAAVLSQTGAAAPDGVWDRIAADLAPAAPPMRMSILPTGEAVSSDASVNDAVTPIAEAPSRRGGPNRALVAVLAVAACIVVVLGAVAVIQSRVDRSPDLQEMAQEAAADSKLKVDLEGSAGTAQAVVTTDGKGYLITDDMPAPADGDVYQLWGKVDGAVLSLGTFGESNVVPFSVDPGHIGDIELFAVTQEAAPGVPSSTQDPIMAGAV